MSTLKLCSTKCCVLFCDQIDQKIEEMFASRKRVTDVATPLVIGANNAAATGQPMIAPNAVQMPSASNQQKLELAKRLASQINMAKNLGPEADNTQQVTAAIMRGDMSAPQISVSQQVLQNHGLSSVLSKMMKVLSFLFEMDKR